MVMSMFTHSNVHEGQHAQTHLLVRNDAEQKGADEFTKRQRNLDGGPFQIVFADEIPLNAKQWKSY